MACGCRKNKNVSFKWLPPQGSPHPEKVYGTEMEAKARVMRNGGNYEKITKGN